MSQVNSEVLECAQHILDFFRRIHLREVSGRERTLTERLEILGGWVKEPESQTSGMYFEISRAKKLREMYERGNIEEIAQYGRSNGDTMTGGMFSNRKESLGFHNETTQNHLRYFHPEYVGNPYFDYAREAKPLSPFYQNLLERARGIESNLFAIRDEVWNSTEFQSASSGKPREEVRAIYLLEEFKRRDKVIPLLNQVETLYSDTIVLTKAVLELSKRPAS